jgi:hypothetical protein
LLEHDLSENRFSLSGIMLLDANSKKMLCGAVQGKRMFNRRLTAKLRPRRAGRQNPVADKKRAAK